MQFTQLLSTWLNKVLIVLHTIDVGYRVCAKHIENWEYKEYDSYLIQI